MDCSPLGSSVHGILQARILEWVAISFSISDHTNVQMRGHMTCWTSLVAQTVKHLPTMWETWVIPGSGRSPGEGNGNLLQDSCLENPMDRGAW